MRRNRFFIFSILVVLLLSVTGCLEQAVKPTAVTDTGEEMGLPPYNGPKARVAVAEFEWKVGGGGSSTTRISGMGTEPVTITTSHNHGYMTGLRDMLTTTMVQTKRYRVLERQNLGSIKDEMALTSQGYTDKSGAKKGGIKGAELLIMGAVTGWEPGTSGTSGNVGGGLFGKAGAILGAIGGGYQKSSMAIDIRIVDTRTSEVLAATRVEGEAKDINIGGALGGFTGSGGMGGGLNTYAKTPMEKAIRTCIYNAVKYIIENTPPEVMKY